MTYYNCNKSPNLLPRLLSISCSAAFFFEETERGEFWAGRGFESVARYDIVERFSTDVLFR